MKKIYLAALFFATFATSSANATGLFVGIDALQANAQHEARNLSGSASLPKDGDVKDSDNTNFGVNAGVRFDLLMFLASAEVFYDNLDLTSSDFALANGQVNTSDSIEIKNRYGAKLNVGMAILPNVTPFLTYGLTNVQYSSNLASNNASLAKSEMTPLYGVGLLVDVPFIGLSAKLSYDYQKLDMQYAQSGAAIKTNLGVAKLGLIYNF